MFHKRYRRTVAVAITLLAAAALAACKSTPAPGTFDVDQIAYDNFRTAVASVPDRQFQVYWLGREFTAGGIVFRGPGWGAIGGIADVDRLNMDYEGRLQAGGGVSLTIGLYSDAAWQAKQANAPVPGGATLKGTLMQGLPAQLYVIPAGTRPINALRLIFRLGETWVLAEAGASGSATPGGPDANPLIDEQTFLSVMQQLRPYPQ